MTDFPSNNWGPFAMQLHALLRQIPRCAPGDAPFWDLARMNSDELAYRLKEAESPFAESIDQAIREWPKVPDALSSLTGTALWFLRLRIDTSSEFVLQFLVCPSLEEGALFDFPAHSTRPEMARLLLLDWWHTHGPGRAAAAMITEYHDDLVEELAGDADDGHGG